MLKIRSERSLEISLFTICAALTLLLYLIVGFKMVVLNLFYLPVVLAAFYLGRIRAGVLALICVLLASVVAVLDLEGFAAATSPLVIGLSLSVWAAVMGLNAIFVGTLSDDRMRNINELKEAHLGVIEVLSRYLKDADPDMKNRSKRVAELSQEVARQMRLSEREVDDVRVAALLHGIDNIEITAKVIHRAVGDLRKQADDQHTFQGVDLVHSLGSVLSGALPLLLNESGGLDFDTAFTEEEEPKAVEAPYGVGIIRAVRQFDSLVFEEQVSPDEAIGIIRSDLDAEHHPAVLHGLEQAVVGLPETVGNRMKSLESLVSMRP